MITKPVAAFVSVLALGVAQSEALGQSAGSAEISEFGHRWHSLAQTAGEGANRWEEFTEILGTARALSPYEGGGLATADDLNAVLRGEAGPGTREWRAAGSLWDALEHRKIFDRLDGLAGCVVAMPAQGGDLVAWELPHLADARLLARALAARAQMQTHEGELDAAMESCERLMLLGEICSRQPILISYLVGIACDTLGIATLRDSVHSADWSPEQLQKMQQLAETPARISPLTHALAGERLVALDLVRSVYGESGKADAARIALLYRQRAGMLGMDDDGDFDRVLRKGFAERSEVEARIETFYREAMEIAALPAGRAAIESGELQQRIKSDLKTEHIVFGLVVPHVERACESRALYEAITAGLRTSIALELHRRAKGEFPDRLDELVPDQVVLLPQDPYTLQPLQYRRGGDRYVLYSVGLDGEDNGGPRPEDDAYAGSRAEGAGKDVSLTPVQRGK